MVSSLPETVISWVANTLSLDELNVAQLKRHGTHALKVTELKALSYKIDKELSIYCRNNNTSDTMNQDESLAAAFGGERFHRPPSNAKKDAWIRYVQTCFYRDNLKSILVPKEDIIWKALHLDPPPECTPRAAEIRSTQGTSLAPPPPTANARGLLLNSSLTSSTGSTPHTASRSSTSRGLMDVDQVSSNSISSYYNLQHQHRSRANSENNYDVHYGRKMSFNQKLLEDHESRSATSSFSNNLNGRRRYSQISAQSEINKKMSPIITSQQLDHKKLKILAAGSSGGLSECDRVSLDRSSIASGSDLLRNHANSLQRQSNSRLNEYAAAQPSTLAGGSQEQSTPSKIATNLLSSSVLTNHTQRQEDEEKLQRELLLRSAQQDPNLLLGGNVGYLDALKQREQQRLQHDLPLRHHQQNSSNSSQFLNNATLSSHQTTGAMTGSLASSGLAAAAGSSTLENGGVDRDSLLLSSLSRGRGTNHQQNLSVAEMLSSMNRERLTASSTSSSLLGGAHSNTTPSLDLQRALLVEQIELQRRRQELLLSSCASSQPSSLLVGATRTSASDSMNQSLLANPNTAALLNNSTSIAPASLRRADSRYSLLSSTASLTGAPTAMSEQNTTATNNDNSASATAMGRDVNTGHGVSNVSSTSRTRRSSSLNDASSPLLELPLSSQQQHQQADELLRTRNRHSILGAAAAAAPSTTLLPGLSNSLSSLLYHDRTSTNPVTAAAALALSDQQIEAVRAVRHQAILRSLDERQYVLEQQLLEAKVAMSEAASSSHANTQQQLLVRPTNEDRNFRRHTKAGTREQGKSVVGGNDRNSENDLSTSLDGNSRHQRNPQTDGGTSADGRQHTAGDKVSPSFLKKRNNERPATQLRRKTNITRKEHHIDQQQQLEVNNGAVEVLQPQEKENTSRGSSSHSSRRPSNKNNHGEQKCEKRADSNGNNDRKSPPASGSEQEEEGETHYVHHPFSSPSSEEAGASPVVVRRNQTPSIVTTSTQLQSEPGDEKQQSSNKHQQEDLQSSSYNNEKQQE